MNVTIASFHPRQARLFVAVTSVLAAWRLLSLDFSSLTEFADGTGNYQGLRLALIKIFTRTLHTEKAIITTQIITSIGLLIGGTLALRPVLTLSLIPACTFSLMQAHFSQPMYMMELPLALLTLCVCIPLRWKDCLASPANLKGLNYAATWFMQGIILYTATCYFFSGISKLEYSWSWPFQAKLGCAYDYVRINQFLEMPRWLDAAARFFNVIFTHYKWADTLAAAAVLFIELAALPLLYVLKKNHLVFYALAITHLLIWLSTGVLFFEMMGLCLLLGTIQLKYTATILPVTKRNVLYLIAAVSLAAFPSLKGDSWPPYLNYRSFGWSYSSSANRTDQQYALGYYDETTGFYRPIPQGYGGFQDPINIIVASNAVRTLVEHQSSAQYRENYARVLEKIRRTMRPFSSNNVILGSFTMPARNTFMRVDISLKKINENLKILIGHAPDATFTGCIYYGMVWKPLGELQNTPSKPEIILLNE